MSLRMTVLALSLCLAACSHEAENTGSENSQTLTLPSATFAFEQKIPSPPDNSPVIEGRVSRFQRTAIVPGGPNGEMTPCAKNFDGIMDNLEGLMAAEIEKNNRFAQVGDMGLSARR